MTRKQVSRRTNPYLIDHYSDGTRWRHAP